MPVARLRDHWGAFQAPRGRSASGVRSLRCEPANSVRIKARSRITSSCPLANRTSIQSASTPICHSSFLSPWLRFNSVSPDRQTSNPVGNMLTPASAMRRGCRSHGAQLPHAVAPVSHRTMSKFEIEQSFCMQIIWFSAGVFPVQAHEMVNTVVQHISYIVSSSWPSLRIVSARCVSFSAGSPGRA